MSGVIGGAGAKSGVIGRTEVDYETGDFTPVYSDAQSGGNTQSGVNWGFSKYTKIGRLVKVQVDIPGISTSGMTGGNVFHVQSLPFVAGSTNYGTMQSYRISRDSNALDTACIIINATNVVKFPWFDDDSSTTGRHMLVSQIISNTSTLSFEITYTG